VRATRATRPKQSNPMTTPATALSYRLQAAGWPSLWITAQTGNDPDQIVALYERIDGRLATTADGFTLGQITAATGTGRAHGAYPPDAYNDDDEIDPRCIPGHKWALADERADEALALVAAIVNRGSRNILELARDLADSHGSRPEPMARKISRINLRLGIRDIDASKDTRIREIRNVLGKVENEQLDLTYAALFVGAAFYPPDDHPANVRWKNELVQDLERREAACDERDYLATRSDLDLMHFGHNPTVVTKDTQLTLLAYAAAA
jgi:hypothetical protein